METESRSLTVCDVSRDGQTIFLDFIDKGGNPAALRLSANQACSLAMTLPRVLDKALRVRFGDQSLRNTYPLGSWKLEKSSDPMRYLMTLQTSDGFGVCFSIVRQQQMELGEALMERLGSMMVKQAN